MTKKERVSIIRIVQDIIRADGIVDLRELTALDDLRTKYGITKDDESAACEFTLSDALSAVMLFPVDLKKELYRELFKVVMSDEINARREALLLLALRYTLTDICDGYCSFISIDASEMDFDSSQILYVESEFEVDENEQICRHYREISSELRVAGLELVYIPKLSEHYCSISEEDLTKMVAFLYPKASDERLCCIVSQMRRLSTAEFCKEQMARKLGMNEMEAIEPSFMLNVGKDTVGGKPYANFLVLRIKGGIVETVRELTDTFSELYNNLRLNYIKDENGRFVLIGYHKQILDLLMLRRGVRSSIVIDPLRERILFPEADVQLEGIHRREKALYALFVLETASGGINFSRPKSVKQLARYDRRMKAVMSKYRLIYKMFSGDTEKAPDLCQSDIRMPMISLLKRRILAFGDVLYHIDDYIVKRNVYGNYSICVPESLCFCCGSDPRDIKHITESEEWLRIAAL